MTIGEGTVAALRIATLTNGRRGGIPRPMEVGIALVALLIALPVLAVCATALIWSSPGTILFRQERVGRGGRIFTLYKLRTMGASLNQGPQVTAGDDARITPVGRWLRNLKLDEIPELWNVVRGDMSLVGPRPEVPIHVDLSNETWRQVLEVRPGITDPTTIWLRNEETLLASVTEDRDQFYRETLQPLKLEGYLKYLRDRTAWSDLIVLWKTLLVVVLPHGAPPPSIGSR